ncbi:HNH endonuclease [Tardiphaga robiniae]|uniref:HNH endonuclease n=1 Tax=Tardiphaga robiniae TaxID=943830 RepID=UPI001585F397|nr:HNH endonuclease [Tardiphaga robiniae]
MTRCARISYSAAEMRWLSDNRTMIISDYHRAFCAAFDRADVTAAQLHGLRKRQGWKVGPRDPGHYAGRYTLFSAPEMEWLQANSTLEIGEYHVAFCAAFSKTDVSKQQLHAARKRYGWKVGRTGRFEKGSVPANKGKPAPYHPNSAATRFKPGQRPVNTKYAGHERVGSQGYVEISIDETNPHTGADRRYVHKHRWLWEKLNGPVPADMVLKCKGEKANPDPSNWEMVPRGLLPRLNCKSGRNYDAAPAELKPMIMAVAKIEHQVRERTGKRDRQLGDCQRPEGTSNGN